MLLAAAAIQCVKEFTILFHAVDPYVFRRFAYILGSGVARFLAVFHLKELVLFTHGKDNSKTLEQLTPLETTTLKCAQSNSTAPGILFASAAYSIHCPTQLWKDIRINVLFAVQAYVLLTLTTSLHSKSEPTLAHWIGALALLESLLLSLAAAIQLDVIEACYDVSLAVGVLVLASQLLYLCRSVISVKSLNGQPPANEPCSILHRVAAYCNSHNVVFSQASMYVLGQGRGAPKLKF